MVSRNLSFFLLLCHLGDWLSSSGDGLKRRRRSHIALVLPSTSLNGESRAGPSGGEPESSPLAYNASSAPTIVSRPVVSIRLIGASPQLSRVILLRRVVAAPSPTCHVSPRGVGTLALPLLAMAELWGRLEASRSVVRTPRASKRS